MTDPLRLKWGIVALMLGAVLPLARGQSLEFSNHREIKIPSGATLRIGPFYSDLVWSEEVGYRYVRTSGEGSGYLFDNQKGSINEDGDDFPIISTLALKNYMIISPTMDLDFSIRLQYRYYPMKTQDDEFIVDMSEEGISADLSTEIELSKTSKIHLYEKAMYRTDYVDSRGLGDEYGGDEYERFENDLGMIWDWRMTRFDDVGMSLSRQDVIPYDDEYEQQEKVGYKEQLRYGHRFSPYLSGGVKADFSQSYYEAGRGDAFSYGASVFVGSQVTRKSSGNASLGYVFTQQSGGDVEPENPDRGTISATLGLVTEFSDDRSQSISYSRNMTEAFEGGFQITDSLSYNFSWNDGPFPGRFFSNYSNNDLSDSGGSSYANWRTGIALSRQLTRLMAVQLTSDYAIRDNEADGATGDSATESTTDYDTWTTRLSTGFDVTRKTKFKAYYDHVARYSDASSLEYERDIVGANLTWSHQF